MVEGLFELNSKFTLNIIIKLDDKFDFLKIKILKLNFLLIRKIELPLFNDMTSALANFLANLARLLNGGYNIGLKPSVKVISLMRIVFLEWISFFHVKNGVWVELVDQIGDHLGLWQFLQNFETLLELRLIFSQSTEFHNNLFGMVNRGLEKETRNERFYSFSLFSGFLCWISWFCI